MTIKVKPLVWVEYPSGNQRAEIYLVAPAYGPGPGRFFLARSSKIIDWGDDPDAMKRVAETDYKTRILSAIEAVDPATIRAEALREAADLVLSDTKVRPWERWGDDSNLAVAQTVSQEIQTAILALIDKEQDR